MADTIEVGDLLIPWQLTAPAFREIDHRQRASRAWWVEASEGRFVAKVSYDRRRFVEPGLLVAAEVARAGVQTGPPVPTVGGEMCVEVTTAYGLWTVALLAEVRGQPLAPTAPGAELVAGDLLGRVHAFLGVASRREWVPADLLEWSAHHAAATGNHAADEVVRAIAATKELVRCSVVYGDPSPEILVDEDGAVGLIDWGTPSWGPQLHDVAAWLRWLGERPGSGSSREERFLGSYGSHRTLSAVELRLLTLYGDYGEAFGFGRPMAPSQS